MRVLITGGAGFIGSNLAKYFNENSPDSEIRILDDLSTGHLENIMYVDSKFTEGSILDYELLKEVTKGVDAIVHLAAIPSVPRSVAAPRSSHDANVTGTLNVLEVARELGIGHVSIASSSSVYGSNPVLPKSEYDWVRPMSPYGASKLAAESYCIAYNFSYGMKTLAFRFFNVYGPGQAAGHAYAAVIPKFLEAALSGENLLIHGDGKQSRDFTFVDTVCSVLYHAVRNQVSSTDPVNLAFGNNTTLLDLVKMIEGQLGRELRVEHGGERLGDVRASQADGHRARELFPSVEPISLEEGLAKSISWFRSRLPSV